MKAKYVGTGALKFKQSATLREHLLSPSNDNTDLSHNDESLEIAIIDIRVFLIIIMAASYCSSIIKGNKNTMLGKNVN